MLDPEFTLYTTTPEGHIVRMFKVLSLPVAQMLSGSERDEFYRAVTDKGWSGTSPAWTEFRPVVIVVKGQMLHLEQFAFLTELGS